MNDMAEFLRTEALAQKVGVFQGEAGQIRTDGGSVIGNARGEYRDGKDAK